MYATTKMYKPCLFVCLFASFLSPTKYNSDDDSSSVASVTHMR